jgi:branched-chain amino acid transport system permease protein
VSTLLDAVLLGVVHGLVYALLSIGLALIFGVVRVVNFAHAEMMMLAAYLVIGLIVLVRSLYLAVALSLALVFLFGYAADRLVLKPVRAKSIGDFEIRSLVGTIGLSLLLANGVFVIAGPDHFRTPGFLDGSVRLGGVVVPQQQVLAAVVSLAAIGLLLLFLQRTRLGMAMRAVKDEPDIVEAFGVCRDRVYATTFGIACALAGLAGVLIAPTEYVYPFMGSGYLLKAFVIVVMAGLGSLNGVLFASIVLGVLEGLSVTFVGSQFGDLMFFVVMVLVLLLRPSGLLGRAEARA